MLRRDCEDVEHDIATSSVKDAPYAPMFLDETDALIEAMLTSAPRCETASRPQRTSASRTIRGGWPSQ